MPTRTLRSLCAAFLFALAPVATAAEVPTPRELIALAPVLDSSDKSIRTIEIAGYNRGEDGRILQTFRVLYRAPGDLAFLMSDGIVHVPINYFANREMLLYDPVRPELLHFSGVNGSWSMKAESGKFRQNFAFKFAGRESSQALLFDLKSLYEAVSPDGSAGVEKVVQTGEKQYLLIKRLDKVYLRSHVDLSRPFPFTRFEVAHRPDASAHFVVDRVVVNGDLRNADFAFPALDRASPLTVRTVPIDGVLSAIDALNLWTRTYYVRQTLHKEGFLAKGVITPALRGVRWSLVRANDEKYAQLVRDLVPAGPAELQARRPEKVDDIGTVSQTALETVRDHLPRIPKVRIKIKF